MSIRRLVEQPVAGGERFSAVIGPAPALRAAVRLLLALALGGTAAAVLLAARSPGEAGAIPWPVLWGSGAAFLGSVAVGCFAGCREVLVCEGHHVVHRQEGALGARRRTIPVLDLTAVRPPRGRVPALGGIRLETESGVRIVARHLDADDTEFLVDALRHHLDLSRPVTRPRPTAVAIRTRPAESATPVETLRHRLPEG